MRSVALGLAFAMSLLASACRDDQDPAGARALWSQINAGGTFRAWRRAPGYPERMPSFTAHADAVEIFVSPEVSDALDGPAPVAEWPLGSIIVKEGFARSGSRKIVAVMEKRADGWFWAEYDDGGEALFSGKPSVCVECHDNRREYADWVYSFERPR
jgi:Cytochrome P460